jgi:hypothetical protein
MKRLILMTASVILAGSLVRAAENATSNLPETTPAHAKIGPCKDILAACNAAGYFLGGHKKGPNKGEWIDCMDPILKGQSVAGVTVDPAVVTACKEVRAKHPGHKGQHMTGGAPANTAAPTGAAQ